MTLPAISGCEALIPVSITETLIPVPSIPSSHTSVVFMRFISGVALSICPWETCAEKLSTMRSCASSSILSTSSRVESFSISSGEALAAMAFTIQKCFILSAFPLLFSSFNKPSRAFWLVDARLLSSETAFSFERFFTEAGSFRMIITGTFSPFSMRDLTSIEVLSLAARVFSKKIPDNINRNTISNIGLFNFELNIDQILFRFNCSLIIMFTPGTRKPGTLPHIHHPQTRIYPQNHQGKAPGAFYFRTCKP
ncbi:Uncharacterised protein [uncultured archaeon]|nr:Uncharacterised protein [uncultured archaeon]